VALQDQPPTPEPPPPVDTPAPADTPVPADTPATGDQPPPNPEPPKQATIENAEEITQVLTQKLNADVHERLQQARDLLAQGNPEAALETLRLALSSIRSNDQVPQALRDVLDREVQVQYRSTVRRQQDIELERAEVLRRQAAAEQRERAVNELEAKEESANLLMVQFDTLMAAGQYNVMANGGLGDIAAATAPFYEARLTAQKARALQPLSTAPRAGVSMSQTISFFAQETAWQELEQYRTILTWQDVTRAAVPFPDTQTIEYPPAEGGV
jgi:hypothetical protein